KTFIAVLSEVIGKLGKGRNREETNQPEEIEREEEVKMSNLYSKGSSSSANEMAEIWDDTLLIKMYEESISSAYNTVAPAATPSKGKKGEAKREVKQEENGWSMGDRCVAPYDGLWYPAVITRIDVSSGTAEVCFDGYDNTETVSVDELYPEESTEGGDQQEGEEAESEAMEVSQQSAPSTSSIPPSRKRTNGGKNGRNENEGRGDRGGGEGYRAPIPSLAPPPPPSFTALPRPTEDDALSSMLMSWYMSGYHTGYYQAMQDVKAGKK
ncbi:hypothetical protein PFISCL1PPCAC_20611, partial [Pristionchus fissidentatus]